MAARMTVGTTSWSYPDWVGAFYPPGTPSSEFLQRYSRVFHLVEADATFYRAPTLDTVSNWASATPADFRFTTKLSRRITHEQTLQGTQESVDFFVSRMKPLLEAKKLAAVLAQFPPSFTLAKGGARLEPFLAGWPKGVPLAVEFRHPSWFVPETYKALRDHGASLVWKVEPEGLSPPEVTADFLYVRLIGPDRVFEKFDRIQRDLRPRVEELRDRLAKEGKDLKDVLLLGSNHFAGHGPATAVLVAEVLGLPKPDLQAAKLPVGKQRGLSDFA